MISHHGQGLGNGTARIPLARIGRRLARVAQELFGAGGISARARAKPKLGPTCANRACMAPRVPPDAYCAACRDEGFTEEAA